MMMQEIPERKIIKMCGSAPDLDNKLKDSIELSMKNPEMSETGTPSQISMNKLVKK